MFLTRGIWWIWPRKVQPETFWMEPAFFKRELILKNIQVKRVPIPSDGLIRNSLCFITRSKHRIINPFYRSHPSAPHRPCYVVNNYENNTISVSFCFCTPTAATSIVVGEFVHFVLRVVWAMISSVLWKNISCKQNTHLYAINIGDE